MRKNIDRRSVLKTIGAGAAATMLPLAAGRAFAQEWPSSPIRVIVPLSAGGVVDRYARMMQPHLEKELGQPVVIENKPGASALIGHQYFLGQPADGNTLLCTASTYIAMNVVMQNAKFSVDDFAFLNLPAKTTSVFSVGPDTPYKTMGDFVNAVRERPGEIPVGTVVGSAHDLNMLLLFESLGLTKEDMRIVSYPGGGPMQIALQGGVIHGVAHTVENSIGKEEFYRPLVVFSDTPTFPFDAAPLVDDVVAELGGKPMRYIPGSITGFATPASLPTEHPERWERLMTAFKNIGADKDILAQFEEFQLSAAWIGPEASTKTVKDSFEVIEASQYLLKQD